MPPPPDDTRLPPYPDQVLDDVARRVEALANRAYRRLLDLLAEGEEPAAATLRVEREFIEAYLSTFADALGQVGAGRFTGNSVRSYPVGDVTLSDALYASAREIASEVAGIVRVHAQGMQDARRLALQLFDGYTGGGDPLSVRNPQLPAALREVLRDGGVRDALRRAQGRAQAVALRTEALKAAYLQAYDAAARGAGQARLERLLRVAVAEKSRYFANRIAQTELARAHSEAVADELEADQGVTVVQVLLSAAHPRPDICDLIALVDRYGLGRGCYPKRLAPVPAYHPHCRCRLRSRPDLSAALARDDGGASERELLRAAGLQGAARIMGSRARAGEILAGRSALDVHNAGIRSERYRVRRIGERRR